MKNSRNKRKKRVAFCLLIIICGQIVMPDLAFALTSGPTAPEATNFEPIDTTDMVNPLTGDMTYGLPLLEVPGPEGGYPLALSYHGGLQTNEDASWVGLGWSLNPGAIARNVNGYPDDWKNVTGSERDFWNGGHTETFNVDVSYGFGATSVSAGLSFSQDTYRGFGVGTHIGLGETIGKIFDVGIQIGVNPYGGLYAAANAGVTTGNMGKTGLVLTQGLSLSTNFKSVDLNGQASLSFGSVRESMSTDNIHPSLTVGGGSITSVNNSKAGKSSSKSHGFTLPIPIWTTGAVLSLGYKYTRYWSDETADVTMNGVLNNRSSISDDPENLGVISLNKSADDNYHLLDPINTDIVTQPNPVKQLGGTYPEFDNYSVTAQGLGGNIRPYIYSSVLYTQNIFNLGNVSQNANAQPIAVPSSMNNKKWQYRFINDFSNYYGQNSPYNPDNDGTEGYNFDSSPIYGNNDGTYGYDVNTNRLEGSTHIEYFTNDEIADPSSSSRAHLRGFVDCDAGGFSRPTTALGLPQAGSQVGGFMITNASGVTYHYALPAYSSNELIHSENLDASNGCRWNELHKNAPYAYTWYLTAITGPDYVDRGAPGLDKDDWGYWVKFDYGQWSKNYTWRNPSEGMQRDINNQFQSFSTGIKEIYYLDAIETRSHTALFVKQLRQDAQSASTSAAASQAVSSDHQCLVTPGNGFFDNSSVPTLGLAYVLLLRNDQFGYVLNTIRNGSNYPNNRNALTTGSNIVDVDDITAYPALVQNCLRKILFNYDYSLCPGVPNSFTNGTSANTTNSGKLTLRSVDFQGKAGTPVTPPTKFQYDLDPSDPANTSNVTITSAPANVPGTNQYGTLAVTGQTLFHTGDILYFSVNGLTYYCTLISTLDGFNFKVLFLNNSPGAASGDLIATRTKNPPYNKDAYDSWGSYKSDYLPSPTNNENLARMTTYVSNASADAWSLRIIAAGTGADIKINYEGDTYYQSALGSNKSLICTGAYRNGLQNYSFVVENESLDLSRSVHIGDHLDIVYMIENSNGCVSTKNTENYAQRPIVTGISDNQITVQVSPETEQDIWTENDTYKHNADNSANVLTANMSANGSGLSYGGGIRVRDVLIDDLNGHVRSTSYNYTMPGQANSNLNSSGVTSYEPVVFESDNTAILQNGYVGSVCGDVQTPYRKELYKHKNNLLAIAREIPAPGVAYEYVTVADSIVMSGGQRIAVEGKSVYQFEVFKPEMIGIEEYYYQAPTTVNRTITVAGNPFLITYQARRNMAIKDYTSRIGNLKRMITYDNLGNKLSEKINHYLYDDLENTSFNTQVGSYESRLSAYHNIGVIKERYGNARISAGGSYVYSGINVPDNYSDLLIMSGKETFPAIQTGTTQIDYKNGTRMDQTNLAFDFYSGAVTKTLTTDSYGNRFISLATPAYVAGSDGSMSILNYPALGLKTFDDDPSYAGIQHKQMLTEQASNYTFTADASNNLLGVVDATAQTWSNSIPVLDPDGSPATTGQSGIWREAGKFVWAAAGTSANNVQPYVSFADYFGTANGGSTNTAWKPTGQVTQYNVYSAALEARDVNSIYAASRMGYSNSQVLITGGPANYNELAYAGAEDPLLGNGNFSNNISPGNGTVSIDSTKAHSGMKSLLVGGGQNGFTYTLATPAAQNYSVAVWVKPSASNVNQAALFYQVNSGTIVTPAQTYLKSAAGWYLLEMTVPATALTGGGGLVVGCKNLSSSALYFDDFRFQPTAAVTTAYVYDNQTGELTYILGNNNLYTRYQYDAIGRLVRTYKEVLNKSTIPIVRGISYNYAQIVFHNNALSRTYYSQNCGTNIAQAYQYTIAANTYSSNFSSAEAYTQALNYLNANGQTQANLYGGCIPTISFSLSNTTYSDYQLVFSDGTTNYPFTLLANQFFSIYVPIGMLSVDIYPTGTYITHTIALGSRTPAIAPRTSFTNVNVSPGSSDLNIAIY